MNMSNHHRAWLMMAVAAIMAVLVSCRDDDGPESVVPAVTNLVTYDGMHSSMATFSFCRIDDSPSVTLRAAVDASSLTPGQRCLMTYVPAGGDEEMSGVVEVRSLSPVTTIAVTVGDLSEYSSWDATPVYVYSLWRSGHYVNIRCRLPYSSAPRMFGLLADRSTLGDAAVQLYLLHDTPDSDMFPREYYASFDLGPLMDESPAATVMDIHVSNSNLDKTVFSLTLPTSDNAR